ncbi:MAG: hypothetical protein KFW21_07145 [Spirochaetota bacterium]|nr:hypothetical protein [Spirochaetota bacterium]
MKAIISSFCIGLIVGGISIFIFLNKVNTLPVATIQISSTDPKQKITEEILEVKSNRKTIFAESSFNVSKAGELKHLIKIPKKDLQFNHSVYSEFIFLIPSQTPLLSLGYSYKKFIFRIYYGYSFENKHQEYGISGGGKWSF